MFLALALATAAGDGDDTYAAPAAVRSPETGTGGAVVFRIVAPRAKEVLLGGEWMPGRRIPMARDASGVWSVRVELRPGLYSYLYHVDGVPTVDPQNPLTKTGRTTQSMVEVQGEPPLFHAVREVPHGTVTMEWYRSSALGVVRRFLVYAPPGYRADQARRYPVLFLLHGLGDDESGWLQVGRAHAILDNLIAEGAAVPMLVVMPNGLMREVCPERRDADLGRNLEEFDRELMSDILPLIERNYRTQTTRDGRAIAGLSMGGGQAVGIGLNHLESFNAVASFSGALLDPTHAFATIDRATAGSRLRPALLWITCGRDDFLLDVNRRFVALLKERCIKHTWKLTAGAHTWAVWRDALHRLLPLLFRTGSAGSQSSSPSSPPR